MCLRVASFLSRKLGEHKREVATELSKVTFICVTLALVEETKRLVSSGGRNLGMLGSNDAFVSRSYSGIPSMLVGTATSCCFFCLGRVSSLEDGPALFPPVAVINVVAGLATVLDAACLERSKDGFICSLVLDLPLAAAVLIALCDSLLAVVFFVSALSCVLVFTDGLARSVVDVLPVVRLEVRGRKVLVSPLDLVLTAAVETVPALPPGLCVLKEELNSVDCVVSRELAKPDVVSIFDWVLNDGWVFNDGGGLVSVILELVLEDLGVRLPLNCSRAEPCLREGLGTP